MRAVITRLVRHPVKSFCRGWNFVCNVHFYWWGLHYRFSRAIEMARNTIY